MDAGRGLGAETLEVRTLLSGQAVQLIKDVNTVVTDPDPTNLTPAGSNLFYEVEDSTNSGVELAVTNAGGTQVLLDTGSSSFAADFYGPSDLTADGNSVYFIADVRNAPGYSQLWTSDGTAAGTVPVPGGGGGGLGGLTVLGSTLIFVTSSVDSRDPGDDLVAFDPASSTETVLESSNLTLDGGAIEPIVAVGGTLYFSIDGDLWSTGGTPQTTRELEDSSSNPIPAPSDLFAYDDQVYYVSSPFGADSSTIGILGPDGETPIVADLPGPISNPVVAGSLFYFVAPSSSGALTQLWASDGTQANTTMLEDFGSISAAPAPGSFIAADGSLFFTVDGSDGLTQLWTSDGTSGGTALVKDLGISLSYSSEYGYNDLALIGGTLFFPASDGVHGDELWSDDVASGTTQLVADIDPGPDGSDPLDLVVAGGRLDFVANDGSIPATRQLWTSGGTAASTSLAASFPVDDGNSIPDTSAVSYATLGSELLLPLNDGINGTSLWETDGTSAGTQSLAAVDPDHFAVLDGTAYFLGSGGGTTYGLWKTDGTSGGTTEVLDLSQYGDDTSYDGSDAGEAVASGSLLYFTTGDGHDGVDLWASDGTPGGTAVVMDFPVLAVSASGATPSSVGDLTPFGGKVAFVADGASDGTQVWITDGTAAGTQMLTDFAPTDAAPVSSDLTVAGDALYFIATTPGGPSGASGLWASDGTAGGTSEVFPFPTPPDPTSTSGAPLDLSAANLTAVGSRLFFSLDYSDQGGVYGVHDQLWTSDGTASGTRQVAAPSSGTFTSLSRFMALGDQLLFVAVDAGGTGIWASDGTAAGTTELKFLSASTSPDVSAYPASTVDDDGILYFAADDGTHGTELWQSDGTSAGTFMVDDINPGAASSNPAPLAVLDGQVVLAADDGTHGIELMELAATSQAAPPQIVAVPTQEVLVGETFQLDLALYASDPNEPVLPLTYSLGAGSPPGMTIDPSTGLLTWPGASDQTAGSYSFTVTASDDSTPAMTASETIAVAVNVAQPPAFNPIPTQYGTVGHTLSVYVGGSATDPNDPPLPLTYSLGANPPSGASITAAGVLTWAIPAGLAPGDYTVPIIATDDGTPPLSADAAIPVEVMPIQPPSISPLPGFEVDPGENFTFDLGPYATDENVPALPLTFALTGGPPGAAIDPTTGEFTWATPANQPPGDVTITFQVSDSLTSSNPAQGSFVLLVVAPVQPPAVQSIPTQQATIGQPFTLDVGSFTSDPNTPALPLTYSLGGSPPSGASIDPTTGVFTWTPATGQAPGAVTIGVVVSDDSTPPSTTLATFTIDVSPAPVALLPPVLRAASGATADVGQMFTLSVAGLASDPNTPPLPLSYSLAPGAPAGVSIDPNSGLLSWNVPTTQKIGSYPVTVIVSDSGSPPQTATETIDLSVVDPGPPPTVAAPTISTRKGFSIAFHFSVPVDPATASDAANYILTEAGKKPRRKKAILASRVIPLKVTYDQATNEVTLKAARKPRAGAVLTLTIVGSGAGGIAKLDGQQLAGGGPAGTNYVATIVGKRLTQAAEVGVPRIVVRTTTEPTRLVRHRAASPAMRRASASVAPGGPLSLPHIPKGWSVILGVIPPETGGPPR